MESSFLIDTGLNKEIIGAIVGGIVVLIFQQGLRYTRYFIRRMSSEELIEGRWYCYFHTNHNSERTIRFTEAELTIRKGVLHKYVVIEKRDNDKRIKYKGVMEQEGHCILIKMDSTSRSDREFVIFRLYHTPPTENHIIHGLQLAADGNGYPYCGALLISQNRMTEIAVKEYFRNYYFYRTKEQTITTLTDKKN